jgi:hypothetical protein
LQSISDLTVGDFCKNLVTYKEYFNIDGKKIEIVSAENMNGNEPRFSDALSKKFWDGSALKKIE